MIALLVGLAFAVVAHVVVCAVPRSDDMARAPMASTVVRADVPRAEAAVHETFECLVGETANHRAGVDGCCGPVGCVAEGPTRHTGAARHGAGAPTALPSALPDPAVHLRSAVLPPPSPPPPATGTGMLQMACISRT